MKIKSKIRVCRDSENVKKVDPSMFIRIELYDWLIDRYLRRKISRILKLVIGSSYNLDVLLVFLSKSYTHILLFEI